MAYTNEECEVLRNQRIAAEAEADKQQRYVDAYSDIELDYLTKAQEANKKIAEAQEIIDTQQKIYDDNITFANHIGKRVDEYKARRDEASEIAQSLTAEINENCPAPYH